MAKMHVCPHCEAAWNREGLRVDTARKSAVWSGGRVTLTPAQSRIMASLATSAGRVVRREALIDAVWGDDEDGGPDDARKSVYVHVCQLRRRLAALQFPGRIVNHHGVGYELKLAA
jgi:DNA-binding response OmpR family regulator